MPEYSGQWRRVVHHKCQSKIWELHIRRQYGICWFVLLFGICCFFIVLPYTDGRLVAGTMGDPFSVFVQSGSPVFENCVFDDAPRNTELMVRIFSGRFVVRAYVVRMKKL
jgi:hypothetical protein